MYVPDPIFKDAPDAVPPSNAFPSTLPTKSMSTVSPSCAARSVISVFNGDVYRSCRGVQNDSDGIVASFDDDGRRDDRKSDEDQGKNQFHAV